MSTLLLSLGPAAWMPGVARHAPVARHAAASMNWVDGSGEMGKGQHWLVDVTPASENLLEGPAPELTPRDVVEAQCDAMKRADVEHFWKFVAPDGDLAVDYAHPQGAQTNFNWKVRNEPRWKNIARRPQAALYTMRDFRIVGTVFTDADKMLVRVSASPYFPDAPGAEAETHFVFTLGRMRASSTHAEMVEHPECWMTHSVEPDYSSWAVTDPNNAERVADAVDGSFAAVAARRRVELSDGDFQP